LTPLSYCDSITVITKFENGKIGCRTLSRESATRDDSYQTDDTKQSFPEFKSAWKLIKSGEWSTAVLIHNHHKAAFGGSPSSPRKYCQNLGKFLGITYNQILDDADIKLSTIKIQHRNKKFAWNNDLIEVVSLDPFWSRFTPEIIKSRIETNLYDQFNKEDFKLMESLTEFGTVASETIPIPIKSKKDDKTYNVKLRAFVLPPRAAKTLIPKRYKEHSFDVGIRKCGTPILQKEHTAGFYFYRNKRCISFGTSGFAKNKGFYEILSSPDNQQLDLRIRIEFPRELDSYFDLEPTKNGVSPPEAFFSMVIAELKNPIHDDLLRGKITKAGNRTPFFDFTDNKKDQSKVLSAKCVAQKFVKTSHLKKLEKCEYCEFSHHRDTVCKLKPCSICSSKKHDSDECNYKCNYCSKVGIHKSSICDKNTKQKGNRDGITPIQLKKKNPSGPIALSHTEPNSPNWTLFLDKSTPDENRTLIMLAIKHFNIDLD